MHRAWKTLPLMILIAAASTTIAGCGDDPTRVSRTQTRELPDPEAWAMGIGSVDYDKSFDVAVDPNGSVFVASVFSEPVDIGGETYDPADGLVFLIKFDPTGEPMWVRQLVGASPDGPMRLGTDRSGDVVLYGIYIAGLFLDGTRIATSNGGADHVFLARFDPDGNLRSVGNDTGVYLSVGFGMDTGEAGGTAVTGFIKAGAVFGDTELSVQGHDIFVADFDASGNARWAWQSGSDTRASGAEVAVDRDNNILVGGSFYQSITFGDFEVTADLQDGFLVKFSPAGEVLWATRLGDDNDDSVQGVATDRFGNVCVIGYRYGIGSALWKYTPEGELLWTTDAPSADDVAVGPSNDIFISGAFGTTLSVGGDDVISNGSDDFFIARYDGSGQGLGIVSGGGPASDRPQGLAVDGFGPVTVVNFSGSFEFSGETITSVGERDVFVARLPQM